jgi:hypothetical protein
VIATTTHSYEKAPEITPGLFDSDNAVCADHFNAENTIKPRISAVSEYFSV